jgi:undecaprenyl-diphosphatase
MNLPAALSIAALALFAIFLFLGFHVSRRPLGLIDAHAVYFRAQATPLAVLFTTSGRMKALLIGYVAVLIVFALVHLPLRIPIILIAAQIVSQMSAEAFKLLFKRVRPDYWLVGLEAGHSYPSGHATTAVVTFAGWALVIAFSALPAYAKDAGAATLLLWAAGIAWSRLALGAHYLSDVAGGLIFGSAWLCALAAILSRSAITK